MDGNQESSGVCFASKKGTAPVMSIPSSQRGEQPFCSVRKLSPWSKTSAASIPSSHKSWGALWCQFVSRRPMVPPKHLEEAKQSQDSQHTLWPERLRAPEGLNWVRIPPHDSVTRRVGVVVEKTDSSDPGHLALRVRLSRYGDTQIVSVVAFR